MKTLCLGNNSVLTDQQTHELAEQDSTVNHGLLSELEKILDFDNLNLLDGFYHTSILDISVGRIKKLSKLFDRVIVLDQPVNVWNYPDEFYMTQNLALGLETPVVWKNTNGKQQVEYWQNLVTTNPSFCIFPFIELLTSNNYTNVCCRSSKPVVDIRELENFATDKNYVAIRNKMLSGELVPDHCKSCYKLESSGILSARQQETVEWAVRLGLQTTEDLKNITQPVYFEVRPSNVCNIMCRICSPTYSNGIEKEWRKLGWIDQDEKILNSNFDIINLDSLKKLYVAGGEPTAMPEFYNFLQQCIDSNNTDFEFIVNTNAVKLTDRALELFSHFKDLHFVVSIDGYKLANDYSRWGSKWDTVISNAKTLYNRGHKVTFNCAISLYTIFSFRKLVEFLESNFPKSLLHGNLVDNVYAFVFVFPQTLIDDLRSIRNSNNYNSDNLFASYVDSLIQLAESSTLNKKQLQHFFDYNDTLDISRNSCLNDYIPELEQLRKLL